MIVSMPLYYDDPRVKTKDKRYYFNLNGYRNWQHFESNKIKRAYKEMARPQLEGVILSTPIELFFTLWKASRRKTDRANVLSVHEKFFCDALTEFGCIEDDNDEYVSGTHYATGGIDRVNPRVEIRIES